jgi:hypothetical protein
MPAMLRIGMPAIGATVAVWALFLPAVVALVTSEGSALFLRLSIIGPLGIAPLFVSSRLIGRVLYLSRDVIDELMWTSPDQVDAERFDPTVETYTAGSVEREHAVRKRRNVAPATAVSKKQRKRRQGVDRLDAPAHPEQRPTTRRPAVGNQAPARPAPQPAGASRSPLRRARPEVPLEDAEPLVFGELDDLPEGFNVLQGADRINAGAAARSPENP